MDVESLLIALLTSATSAAMLYFFVIKAKKENQSPASVSPQVNKEAIDEAKEDAKKLIIEAKEEAVKIKERAEQDSSELRKKALEAEKRAESKFDELYNKIKEVEKKEKSITDQKETVRQTQDQIEKLKQEQIDKLSSIASLTREEAKQLILSNLENSLQSEMAKKIKEFEEKLQTEADLRAKELLTDAMHHAATDYVPEYTLSTVKLPSDDLKGKIIGKEGRNIKAFEDHSGVNVDFDDENSEIRLSSFDSVRREVARIALEKLIKDGRIHPGRIEEVLQKTEEELDKIVMQAGMDLCNKVGVFNLPKELVKKLGNFKYRTSYGQNMIQHTLEETKIAVKLAQEINADVPITKLAALLHDIGKVITDKEGNHIELGVEYLKQFNIPKPVLTAIAEHHHDKPSSVEGILIQIADSISGSRPGARYEDYENYVKRMQKLEEAAFTFTGVSKAFAISAGRELRVIVKTDEINDVEAVNLSHKIAKKIEEEQTFPGIVKVVVIREIRAIATAS
jgi:ribonucrease Y